MPITITTPTNPHFTNDTGHTTDHNTIVTALTTLGNDAANVAGDTFTGNLQVDAGLTLNDTTTPGTPSGGNSVLYADSNGSPIVKLSSGGTGNTPLSKTGQGGNTVTQASLTALSDAYTISANDAKASTVYKLTAWGNGTQGSTQQNLSLHCAIGGPSPSMASGTIGISAGFSWVAEIFLVVTATGSGGTCNITVKFTWTQVGAAASTSNNATGIATNTGVSINTATSNTFQLQAQWASTTGSPTLTCDGSYMERLGS